MPSTRSPTELMDLLRSHSRAIAYDLAEPLSRFMTNARETFDGDLDKALIMCVVSLRSSRHPTFLASDDPELAVRAAMPGYGTNVRSIADSTGMPRETVRRKVQHLIDCGWIVRDGRNIYYSVEGYNAAAGVRDCIMRMYARGYLVIGGLELSESRKEESKIEA